MLLTTSEDTEHVRTSAGGCQPCLQRKRQSCVHDTVAGLQDAASKALQEPSNLEASARSGASRSLQTQISQHEDPSQPATSSTGAHTYNGVKLGRNVLSATTQPVLAKPADTKPPPQKGVSSTSHIPQADTSSAKMPTKEGPTFVLQNIFRRSMLTEEGVWTEKMAQQHMANM